MKKRLEQKLGLRKETLRDLDAAWLGHVAGGMPEECDEYCTCYCPPPKKE